MSVERPVTGRSLRAAPDTPVRRVDVGRIDYRPAWELQRRLVERRRGNAGGDVLLLVEHPPVYTLGSRTDRAHVLWDEARRRAHGIDLVEVDRGGDVTYHGPGQLVGYPIIALASIRTVVAYVRAIEETLIRTLATFEIDAHRVDDYTGVWVGEAKIAAIGVRVASGGITSHGFALNVAPDLAHFTGIVPCGIPDRGVCSMAELGVDVDRTAVVEATTAAFADVFGATLVTVPIDDVDQGEARDDAASPAGPPVGADADGSGSRPEVMV